MNPSAAANSQNPPWWRVGMVWLVLAGPAIVVVASFATLRLALIHVDPVIQDPPVQSQPAQALTPAMSARNHAATPRP
jgi:hypothetical protein